MWKESNRNIVVIFQPNILRIVRFYVRHSAYMNFINEWLILERVRQKKYGKNSFRTLIVVYDSTQTLSAS